MKVFLSVIYISFFLGIWVYPTHSEIAENEQRIVGGNATTIEEYPYAAQLYLPTHFRCGATIISPNWVLTAGHCTYGVSVNNVTLRIGATKYNQTNDEAITLSAIYIHPLYNGTILDYDISILLLTDELTFGPTIGSVPLPPANVVLPAGTLTTVVGWGTLSADGPDPTQLQVVQLPIITNEECARRYNNTVVVITDKALCAGYDEGGKDSCQGDSGGPLTVDGVLYGLVSKGLGCADARYPGAYTNVSSLRSYIQEITGL